MFTGLASLLHLSGFALAGLLILWFDAVRIIRARSFGDDLALVTCVLYLRRLLIGGWVGLWNAPIRLVPHTPGGVTLVLIDNGLFTNCPGRIGIRAGDAALLRGA